MRKILLAIASIAFLAPVAAEAAGGFATANVNMRSGPSTRYPAVTVIPVGTPVEIHGCLAEVPWCDVSFYRGRGWVSGQYVQAQYRQNRVYLDRQYYRPLGIPTVTFELGTYWDRNYRGRDFYRDRDYWRRGPDRDVNERPPRRRPDRIDNGFEPDRNFDRWPDDNDGPNRERRHRRDNVDNDNFGDDGNIRDRRPRRDDNDRPRTTRERSQQNAFDDQGNDFQQPRNRRENFETRNGGDEGGRDRPRRRNDVCPPDANNCE